MFLRAAASAFVLAAALFAIFRDRLTEAIMGALLWAVIGIVLVIGYSYRYEVKIGRAHV